MRLEHRLLLSVWCCVVGCSDPDATTDAGGTSGAGIGGSSGTAGAGMGGSGAGTGGSNAGSGGVTTGGIGGGGSGGGAGSSAGSGNVGGSGGAGSGGSSGSGGSAGGSGVGGSAGGGSGGDAGDGGSSGSAGNAGSSGDGGSGGNAGSGGDAGTGGSGGSGTMIKHLITFYGWPDNDPPSGNISYPGIHQKAGGVGTFEDPITFASDPGEWPAGTKLYVPYIKRYVVMEDYCAQCVSDWGSQKYHIDIWLNSNGQFDSEVIQCEEAFTRSSEDVEENPPAFRYQHWTVFDVALLPEISGRPPARPCFHCRQRRRRRPGAPSGEHRSGAYLREHRSAVRANGAR